jgi:hypothetical protein
MSGTHLSKFLLAGAFLLSACAFDVAVEEEAITGFDAFEQAMTPGPMTEPTLPPTTTPTQPTTTPATEPTTTPAYIPPNELHNPLDRPPGELSVTKNICGADFHQHFVRTCNSGDAPGSSFYIAGKKCTIEASETKPGPSNYGSYCCIKCQLNANTSLFNGASLYGATKVEIAPMKAQGDPLPDPTSWTEVNGESVFDAILARADINPAVTSPNQLNNAPGFLELISGGDSQVLHNKAGQKSLTNLAGQSVDFEVLAPTGERATLGYFIRAQFGAQSKEHFALFSYDQISILEGPAPTEPGVLRLEKTLRAFEFFLFGSFTRDLQNQPTPNTPPVLQGLAIAANKSLLAEVPVELAHTSNFGVDRGPVLPGVNQSGQGCYACHERRNRGINATTPFPWVAP